MKLIFPTAKMGGWLACKPLLALIASHGADVFPFIMDQHEEAEFGGTARIIQREADEIGCVGSFCMTKERHPDKVGQMKDSSYELRLGHRFDAAYHFSMRLIDHDITVVLLFGDRFEVPLLALASHNSPMRPLIVHIQGGDTTGGVDDAQRLAASKLAHIHLVSTERSRRRLLSIGEQSERVFVVGDLHLDSVRLAMQSQRSTFERSLDMRPGEYYVACLHPDTSSIKSNAAAESQAIALAGALAATGKRVIWLTSCNDPMFQKINAVAERFTADSNGKHLMYRYLDQSQLVPLMQRAAAVVGNSSMGLIEAPFVGTQCVNVGGRQAGREYNTAFVTHCAPETDAITSALLSVAPHKQQQAAGTTDTIYGDGFAASKAEAAIADCYNMGPIVTDKSTTIGDKDEDRSIPA